MNPLSIMIWRLIEPTSLPTEAAICSFSAIVRIDSPSGELTRFWARTIDCDAGSPDDRKHAEIAHQLAAEKCERRDAGQSVRAAGQIA